MKPCVPNRALEAYPPWNVAVLVAHPDDEVLWAGGLLMMHPEWRTLILAGCRKHDPDRAPRFRRVLECLHAEGVMGDLEDGPGQKPLPPGEVRTLLGTLLPKRPFDLVLTHGPSGEYTQHRRHEEISAAVRELWQAGEIQAARLWVFAYQDGGGAHPPWPRSDANLLVPLPQKIWQRKIHLITKVYGFAGNSWEAKAAPRVEAFRCSGPYPIPWSPVLHKPVRPK